MSDATARKARRPAWVNWAFASRTDGKIVIGQWPNAPLWAFIAAVGARFFTAAGTTPNALLSVVAAIGLSVWAIGEIGWGVNPFRRGFGAVVLAAEVFQAVMTVIHR